jgi:hypothetical protein
MASRDTIYAMLLADYFCYDYWSISLVHTAVDMFDTC